MQRGLRLEWLARAGYASRGIVFIVLSVFTILAATGARAHPVGGQDALHELLLQPFGALLLLLLAAGLMCFGIWRAVQSAFDPDGCGADMRGVSRRVVYAFAALFYLAFAAVIVSMIFWDVRSESERAVQDWTAWALTWPRGRWIVGGSGIAIFATGVGIAAAGLRARIRDYLALNKGPRLVVSALGLFGSLTRGSVFMIIGAFVIFAAIDANSHEATGLAGALMVIKEQRSGALLLSAAAMGFFSFGLFGFAEAAFRRIDTRCTTELSWLWT
jgi:hypothetical protein